MAFALGPKATAAGYRLDARETVGSTNAEALALARAGDPGRLWVVSDYQSAGRGRRNSAWQTPRGNLAATILSIVSVPPVTGATLGFVAGLCLDEALRSTAGLAPDRLCRACVTGSYPTETGQRLYEIDAQHELACRETGVRA